MVNDHVLKVCSRQLRGVSEIRLKLTDKAVLSATRRIPYDVLVIASGSDYHCARV